MPICTVKNIDSLCVCLPLSFQKVQKAKSKQGYRGRKLETENTLQRKNINILEFGLKLQKNVR